jgi:hypothetical protein
MTQEQHPIVPPPELVRKWMEHMEYDEDTWFYESYIAEQAAQWGADQELEACCEWINSFQNKFVHAHDLRLVRRPKPPSLKDRLTVALQNEDIGTALRLVEQLDD